MTRARVRSALLAAGLAAPVACGVHGVQIAHFDAERQIGLVRAPLGRDAHRQPWRAEALARKRCGAGAYTVLEHGFQVSEPYRAWTGEDPAAPPGSVYYWVFSCLPHEQPGARAACVEPRAAPAGAAPASTWLELASPAPGERSFVPLVELRGTAGPRGGAGREIAIVLDLSDSTLEPSGFDVDGDGPGGRTSAPLLALLESRPGVDPVLLKHARQDDFDDSVLLAVLTAAKLLIDRIDLAKSDVGLVAFSSHARVVAPIGSDRATLLEALRALRVDATHYLRSTYYAGALQAARGGAPRRARTVVLLSDLKPPAPFPAEAVLQQAIGEARAMAAAGMRLEALALGPLDAEAESAWRRLADCTGGRVQALERPGDVVFALRELDLAGVERVVARNETTGSAARALRVFPTGEFDGFIDLAPGRNVIHVETLLEGGARAQVRREVELDATAAPPAAELERLRALVQRRSLELQLWEEMKRTRRRQERVLDLSLDEPTPPAEPAR